MFTASCYFAGFRKLPNWKAGLALTHQQKTEGFSAFHSFLGNIFLDVQSQLCSEAEEQLPAPIFDHRKAAGYGNIPVQLLRVRSNIPLHRSTFYKFPSKII